MTGPKPYVLHISADFPDPVDPNKTKAVKSLVDLTGDDFSHRVLSLNRRSPEWSKVFRAIPSGFRKLDLGLERQVFEYGEAISYSAPPRGIAHETMLRLLGRVLAKEFENAVLPDLIVGHKLTIEGIVAQEMAKALGVSYALCVQGDTDTKVLAARPDLKRVFANIYSGAKVVFPFSPWSRRAVEGRLGAREEATIDLPCATHISEVMSPKPADDVLVTVFHLKNARRKNLKVMVKAMQLLARSHPGATLRVIGGGSAQDFDYCRRLIAGAGNVSLEGAADTIAVRQTMNAAAGFVLPSLRESFGMVFVEAVLSGVPIIYPKGTAVDGFFDDCEFALRVDARNVEGVARAMAHTLDNQSACKAALAQWQKSAAVRRFSDERIAADFKRGLLAAIGD